MLLLINNETHCVPLLFLSSKFMTYAPCLILGKSFLEKNTTKSRPIVEIISNLEIV